jgi:hypothetical protein
VIADAGSFRPPASPWTPIAAKPDAGSYVSVYLSSDVARLPVRDIMRLADNKSDPNLETGTYGLWSTCEATMRKSIVNRGIEEIFFITTVEGIGRALVGRYALGWVAQLGPNDAAFAAKAMRFVRPIPVSVIPGNAGKEMQATLRNYKIVREDIAAPLRSMVDAEADRTQDYLLEIDRLERMSFSRTGFRYPSWDRVDAFSWLGAGPYLAPSADAATIATMSPSGRWRCRACGAEIRNEARLKICNVCGERNTLIPEGAGT